MERDDLLHRIRQERARLDEAMSRVPDDRVLERDNGAWTGKDHLAHLATWQRVALARVTGIVPDDIADVVRGEYTEEGIDAINERFYEAGRDRSLKDVRADFTTSYDATCHAVEALDDADLGRDWLPGHPERGTLAQTVAANTSEHYDEHIWVFETLAERESPAN
jgi:hypothetical protein